MNISEIVAQAIMDILESSNGEADIQRNELAASIGCVPSQINYVISSRFTPERGYTVESRRGGGGYIRITKIRRGAAATAMHMVNSIGNTLDFTTARVLINDLVSGNIIPSELARVMLAACSDSCYRECEPEQRDKVRASIFKHMLINSV